MNQNKINSTEDCTDNFPVAEIQRYTLEREGLQLRDAAACSLEQSPEFDGDRKETLNAVIDRLIKLVAKHDHPVVPPDNAPPDNEALKEKLRDAGEFISKAAKQLDTINVINLSTKAKKTAAHLEQAADILKEL